MTLSWPGATSTGVTAMWRYSVLPLASVDCEQHGQTPPSNAHSEKRRRTSEYDGSMISTRKLERPERVGHLLPVIEQMLDQFPFTVLGFHADNGSEYINHRVAGMLNKLCIEFTRSRPRHSNDNGLAETKNGAVVRKIFGYGHIPQHHAAHFNTFCVEFLNPFLNFHRPCLFSTDVPDPKKPGRIKRTYRPKDAMTPLDKLASLPDAASFHARAPRSKICGNAPAR
jgi:hypothetical protein